MKLYKLLLSVMILLSQASFAAESANEVEVPEFSSVFTNLPENWSLFKDEVVAPKNRLAMYTILASTAVFVAYDYEMFKESEKLFDQSKESQDIHWAGVSIGDGYFQFGLAGALGAWGYASDDSRLKRTSIQIVEVILSTGAVVQLMKHFTGRESPFKNTERSGRWEPFPEQVRYYKDVQRYDAVPSGHLATYFGTFRVIMKNYPEQKWIPWAGWIGTAWVAQGLLGTGLHWASDYPIAIGLGYLFSDIVTSRNEKSGPFELEAGSVWNRPIVSVVPSHVGAPIINMKWRW